MKRVFLRITVVMILVSLILSFSVRAVVFTSDAVIPADQFYNETIEIYDTFPATTTIDCYGSAAAGITLIMHDSSALNLYDGAGLDSFGFPGYILYDSSTLNMYEGAFIFGMSMSCLELNNSSTFNMYGGDLVTFLFARGSSVANIYDGYLSYEICTYENSTINVYGGTIKKFFCGTSIADTSTINIFGTDFQYDPYAAWYEDDGEGWWASCLTGTGLDGVPITYWGLPDPATHDNINLIPEPATLLLLGLGVVMVRKRQ